MERSNNPDDIRQRKSESARRAFLRAHNKLDAVPPGIVYMIDSQARQIEPSYSRGHEPMRQAIVYDKARGKWQIAGSNLNIPVTPRSNLIKASIRDAAQAAPQQARHKRTARGQR